MSVPWRGHNSQLLVLAEALAGRGHRVSYVLTESTRHWLDGTGVQFIPWPRRNGEDGLARLHEIWAEVSAEPSVLRGERRMFDAMIDVYPYMYEALSAIFAEERPDALVIDKAVIPAMDLAWQVGLPYVVMSRSIGFYLEAAPGQPRFGTWFPRRMTAWQRLNNALFGLRRARYFRAPVQRARRVRAECLGTSRIARSVGRSPMIVGSMLGLELERPLPPWLHLVGPILPPAVPPLAPSLASWLDERASGGVVYVSFGTLVRLAPRQWRALASGLAQCERPILWSVPASDRSALPSLPAQFRVESWVAQEAVLAHPAVRVYVGHAGMNGLLESLYHGVPILALPFFGDQHYNAARLCDLGVALALDKRRLHGRAIAHALGRLLEEETFTDAARDVSAEMRRLRGLDRAVEIVEGVLRRD